MHDLDGQVLLLGVAHSESTMLHVAESIASVPYSVLHPCIVEVDGHRTRVMIPETDHCCRGFCRMDDWLGTRGLQCEGKVGGANGRLSDARDIVAVAVEKLAEDPLVFLCPSSEGCEECDDARASVRHEPAKR